MVNKDIELFESPISKKRLLLACLHYFVGYAYVYPMILLAITGIIFHNILHLSCFTGGKTHSNELPRIDLK